MNDFTATLQFGIVAETHAGDYTAKVRFPALDDMVSDWLPVVTTAAGGNRFYCLPDVGALVVCVLDAHGEAGAVLGAVYNAQDATPAADADLHVLEYSNGTRIEHNRKTGNVLVKTSGVVTVDADCVVKKTLTVNGLLTYTGAWQALAAAARRRRFRAVCKHRGILRQGVFRCKTTNIWSRGTMRRRVRRCRLH